jgi:AraC family transcriptional regulator
MEEKPAMRFVGRKEAINNMDGYSFVRIPQIWRELCQDDTFDKIMELSNQEPCGVMGICATFREKEFDYYVASATDKDIPEGMDELIVPAGLWVIFEVWVRCRTLFKKYGNGFTVNGFPHQVMSTQEQRR